MFFYFFRNGRMIERFSNEEEMIKYFARYFPHDYDAFVADQNLTGNDTKKYVMYCSVLDEDFKEVWYYDKVFVEPRTSVIIRDDYAVIDLRNYYSEIKKYAESHSGEDYAYVRRKSRRIGKCHRKKHRFKNTKHFFADSKVSPWIDTEYGMFYVPKRKRKELDFDPYEADYVSIENNWKHNKKAKRQYMWHKLKHKSSVRYDKRDFCYKLNDFSCEESLI